MKWRTKRRLKKEIKSIQWDKLDELPNYTGSGEYQALHWLKSYWMGKAAAEPRELLDATLWAIIKNPENAKYHAAFALTILRYVD